MLTRFASVLAAFLLLITSVNAQQSVRIWNGTDFVSVSNPLAVSASVSASIAGFAPSLSYATCTATDSACASTAIPTNSGSVVLFNSGTTTVSCTLASGAATGATNKLQIPASSGLAISTVYSATTYDHFACIDQTGSTSNVVIASGGSGLPTGWGGGGGSGGGGAVTIASGGVASGAYASGAFASGAAASGSWADGSIVALGAIGDSAWVSGNGTEIALLKNIANGIAGPIPAASPTSTIIGSTIPAAGATGGAGGTTITPAGGAVATNFITAAATTLYSVTATNTGTHIANVRIYNSASAPTCTSATNLVFEFDLMSSATSPGMSPNLGPVGILLSNGLAYCISGAYGHTDNTNGGWTTGDIVINTVNK